MKYDIIFIITEYILTELAHFYMVIQYCKIWWYDKVLYNLQFEDAFVLFHFTILVAYLHYL